MATSIRLDADLEQRIDQLAQDTGRSKAYYLGQLVANGLDDMEDYYRGAATMERLRKGQETVHSAAKVRQRLGLESSLHRYSPLATRQTGEAGCQTHC